MVTLHFLLGTSPLYMKHIVLAPSFQPSIPWQSLLILFRKECPHSSLYFGRFIRDLYSSSFSVLPSMTAPANSVMNQKETCVWKLALLIVWCQICQGPWGDVDVALLLCYLLGWCFPWWWLVCCIALSWKGRWLLLVALSGGRHRLQWCLIAPNFALALLRLTVPFKLFQSSGATFERLWEFLFSWLLFWKCPSGGQFYFLLLFSLVQPLSALGTSCDC